MEEINQNSKKNSLVIELTPIFCPNNEIPTALTHPRIYLNTSIDGTCRCPYAIHFYCTFN